MVINYVDGDLFSLIPQTNEPKYIPHVCNNIGRMGSGFALAAMTHYPVVKDDYLQWYNESMKIGPDHFHKFQLGRTQFVVVQATPTIVICNMIAQSGLIGPNNPKPIKYAALLQCMIEIAENIKRCCETASIHAPMFGSGLAGGNADLIKELINECWISAGIPVTIYIQ